MADERKFDQLDAAVQALLSGAQASPNAASGEVAALAQIAADLRGLSRNDFQLRLKSELERKAEMTTAAQKSVKPIREGFHTVTPYLAGPQAVEVLDFIQRAFGATETLRTTGSQGGLHAEARLGDSMLMLGGYTSPKPAALHYFVSNTDEVYRRAIEAGAESVYPPTDQPYAAREAGVRDPGGNLWFISTPHDVAQATPQGFHTITPYLLSGGSAKLIDFLTHAWDAQTIARHESPEGRMLHASVRLGDSAISMGDPAPPWQPMLMLFYLYVEDCDGWYRRAMAAGASSIHEPRDESYGDRVAAITDPLGNQWYIGTHIRDVAL